MVLTASALCALQTSLWFLVFGRFPAPLFWLIILVYTSVTRPLWEATLMAYLLAFVSSSFSVFPFEAMLIFALVMMVLIYLVRERVFWGGPTFFMLMVAAAVFAAPVIFWIISRVNDKNPVFLPEIFEWLISALLTVLFSLPIYRLYQWFDRLALMDAGSEGRIGPR